MKYAIIYDSRTGNTRLLADTLKSCLPPEDCIYCGEPDICARAADRLYVGFWTDKGVANGSILNFLDGLSDKEIFLFGSAGFGGNQDYFDRILRRTKEHIQRGNTVIGAYMCQGKMPPSVRERYVRMAAAPQPLPNIQQLIDNFDRALEHPDSRDLDALRAAVRAVTEAES